MVELQPSKLTTWVRFSSPAPFETADRSKGRSFVFAYRELADLQEREIHKRPVPLKSIVVVGKLISVGGKLGSKTVFEQTSCVNIHAFLQDHILNVSWAYRAGSEFHPKWVPVRRMRRSRKLPKIHISRKGKLQYVRKLFKRRSWHDRLFFVLSSSIWNEVQICH